MRPMSLYESKESNGDLSLSALFEQNNDFSSIGTLEIEDIARAITRGGWPASVTAARLEFSEKRAIDYVDSIVQYDISQVDGVEKNPQKIYALLRFLSRNLATEANNTITMKDCKVEITNQ